METSSKSTLDVPLYLCNPFLSARLVTGSFKAIIQLPKYTDISEWVAMNLFDFYTNLDLFLGFLLEFCTHESCPTMAAGTNFIYPWIEKNGRSASIPAPTHIDYIMTWISSQLDDQTVFPTRVGVEFPKTFPASAKNVYRQLFHVFAHIYHSHFTILLHARSEGHFNSLFAHFLAFGAQFDLWDQTDLCVGSGSADTKVSVAEIAEKWKEMGYLA
ncbi:hypothetical protein BS47DRAFT_1353451 [Hydnum rufescens UP504]|uniref:Maintenance of ploidy protein mob2 n=1 Tax=Hydnum rufescens UP504 TaxID=1448309 RepID=A0A9P6AHH8_9AGAM|nr:hypothetical protein BS47DRAFT_1353451 [Hydnum rufescens UP504]